MNGAAAAVMFPELQLAPRRPKVTAGLELTWRVPPCAAGDKKARLVRERGDACTAVSRAEVSLPREGVRVSMSVGTSVRVRVRVSCWFDRY
jgi:hypothetical protein